MKVIIFLSFIAFFSSVLSSAAQSVYYFKYNFASANDTNTYHALFLASDDGAGVVRIKHVSPLNGQVVLTEMKVQEQYNETKDGNTAYDKIYYQLSDRRSIMGDEEIKYDSLLFCFRKNGNNEFEPSGAAIPVAREEPLVKPFSEIKFIERKDLTPPLVQEYFSKDDEIYKNLFKVEPRDLPLVLNTNLILLAVANVNDPVIGSSCLKDMNRMAESFAKLADFIGVKFKTKTIAETDYNKKNVEKEINALQPLPNDIVVFYYSGHGFRKPKDSRRFPYIDLRPKPDDTYMINSMNLEDIYNTIQQKGARLNLIISDCCNTEVDASNAIGTPVPRKKGIGDNWSQLNCRALFLNPKPMSLLVAAADRGQRASGNNGFGGFFSY
ncbi:MAG TPA: caspase family protein, partial [Segetibacter sp.]